jgi:hypothetical protein
MTRSNRNSVVECCLIAPEETHDFYKQEWTSRRVMLEEIFPVSPQAFETTRALVDRGVVILTPEFLGPGNLWWEPDGPPASIDEDEIGWTTSRTDAAWWSAAKRPR